MVYALIRQRCRRAIQRVPMVQGRVGISLKTKFKKRVLYIGIGRLSPAGDRQIPKCTDPFTLARKQDYIRSHFQYGIPDYITKSDIFLSFPIKSETRFGGVCYCDFGYVTSFTKFQILAEIQSRKVYPGLNLGNYTKSHFTVSLCSLFLVKYQ